MMIDDLIEKLYELEREYGEVEVELYTQTLPDTCFWDFHDVDEVFYYEDGKIVIQGKEKTEVVE